MIDCISSVSFNRGGGATPPVLRNKTQLVGSKVHLTNSTQSVYIIDQRCTSVNHKPLVFFSYLEYSDTSQTLFTASEKQPLTEMTSNQRRTSRGLEIFIDDVMFKVVYICFLSKTSCCEYVLMPVPPKQQ